MRYIILFLLLSVSLCYSCQSEKESNPKMEALKVNFSVRYLATERMLRGQALWYSEDTSLVVQPDLIPGGVAFMSSGMQSVELPGNTLRYQTEMRVDYPDSTSFSFRLMNDQEPNNVYLKMPGVRDFSFEGPIRLSTGATLQLAEGPLQKEENLTLLFTDEQQQTRTVIIKGPTSQSKIKLEALSLANLSIGLQQLYIVRSRNWEETMNGLEMTKVFEVYSRTQEVVVEE